MKFVHGPQRMNIYNFHNSLTFHLAFLLVDFFSYSQYAWKYNDQIQPHLHFDFNTCMQICQESVTVKTKMMGKI